MTTRTDSSPASSAFQPSTDARPVDSEFGFLSILNIIVRRRGMVLATMVVVELILLVVALQRPLRYTSVVAFMPEGQRPASGVGSLAAQFGVNVNTADGLSSPQFYPELVRSPQFLAAVVDSQYPLNRTSGAGRTLVEVYGIEGGNERTRRALAVQQLNSRITVNAAPRTGIVTIGVTADQPELARDIAARILGEITRFNQHTRQGRAAAERQFVERRLADVRDSLRATEDRLAEFISENRDYRTSPTLAFRYARLQRAVEAQQLLLATLAPSYEQAKIEEVRDTPVLTVLRRPEAPVYPNPRGRVRLMFLGLIGGLALGVALVLATEAWRHLRASPDPASREFVTLTSDIKANLRDRRFVRAIFGSRKS